MSSRSSSISEGDSESWTYLLLDPTFSSESTTLEIVDVLQDPVESGHVGSKVGRIGAGLDERRRRR